MKEVQYIVQIKTSVIRQVEFIDMPNLSAAEIEEYAKGLAHMEVGDFDESEILLVETHPTMQDDDVEKDAPMTLTDMPRPWSEGDMQKAHLTPLALDLPNEPVNYCVPVNGVHAPFCTGHKSASQ